MNDYKLLKRTFFNFAGVNYDRCDISTCLDRAIEAVNNSQKFTVAVPSSRMVLHAQKDKRYRDYVNKSDLVIPDSISVVYASRFTKKRLKHRIAGPDFMMALCKKACEEQKSVYFIGTTTDTLQTLSVKLKQKFSDLKIAGYQALPFGDVDEMDCAHVISAINSSKPDILFVAMSAPKQEYWISRYRESINAFVFAGVGAAFDFHSQNVQRAPHLFRLLGIEWLFRHLIDPKRKLSDFYKNLPPYAYLVFMLLVTNNRFILKIYQLFFVTMNQGILTGCGKFIRQIIKYDKRFIFLHKGPLEVQPDDHFQYRELDEDALTNIQFDRSIACVEKFWNLSNGADRCFGCYEDGVLIHISWVFHSDCSSVDIGEQEAFIGPCITFRSSRKGGAYKNMLIYLSRILYSEGYERIYGSTSLENVPSIRGLISAGFKISRLQRKLFIVSRKIITF